MNDPFTVILILLLTSKTDSCLPDNPINRIVVRNVCENKDIIGQNEQLLQYWAFQKSYLREWYCEVDNLPAWSDVYFLPPPTVSKAMLDFSDGHINFLEQVVNTDKRYKNWLIEAKALRKIWKSVYSAHPEAPYDGGIDTGMHTNICKKLGRRTHLRFIRDEIGEANYYHQRWPVPVPIWRFNEIR